MAPVILPARIPVPFGWDLSLYRNLLAFALLHKYGEVYLTRPPA